MEPSTNSALLRCLKHLAATGAVDATLDILAQEIGQLFPETDVFVCTIRHTEAQKKLAFFRFLKTNAANHSAVKSINLNTVPEFIELNMETVTELQLSSLAPSAIKDLLLYFKKEGLAILPIMGTTKLYALLLVAFNQPHPSIINLLQEVKAPLQYALELKQTTDELYRRNEVYETVLSTLSLTMWEMDIRSGKVKSMGRLTSAMPLTQQDLSLEPEEMFTRYAHEADKPMLQKQFKTLLASENSTQDDYTFRWLNREQNGYVWIRTRRRIIKDLNNEPVFIIGTSEDITESRQQAFELEKQKEQYGFLLQTLDQVVFRLSNQGVWEFLSPSWETLTGHSLEHSAGHSYKKFIPAHALPELEKTILRLLNGLQQQCDIRTKMLHSNGNAYWYRLLAKNVTDENNHVSGIFGTLENVHQKYQAEILLQESNEQLNIIFNSTNEIMFTIDLEENRIEQVNESIALLGYSTTEWMLGLQENAEHIPQLQMLLELAAKNNNQVNNKLIQLHNRTHEKQLYFEYSSNAFNFKNKKYLLCILKDVSERENLLQELEQSLENEKEISGLKSMFISMASHQFRTPLTVIQSSVELMEIYLEKLVPEEQQPYLRQTEKITTEINRLQDLMNDVLLLGRADANRTPFHPEKTSLLALCKQSAAKYNLQLPVNRQVLIELVGTEEPVEIDVKLMSHVVENLLSNAIKYSQKEHVLIQLNYYNHLIDLHVADKGIGIPEEELNNIFQPFYRTANTAEIQGTGLGLVVVKEYVELHGGKIAVISKLDAGTTVTITLPIQQPS
jgi:PAS domain S-box-containing protein